MACAHRGRPARIALALLATLGVAACSLQPTTVEQPPPPPPPVAAAVPDDDIPAIDETPPATLGCDPAPVQSLLGQVATAALQSRARAKAGADSLRLLAPGQAADKAYRAGRLNLQLDADKRLAHAYCG